MLPDRVYRRSDVLRDFVGLRLCVSCQHLLCGLLRRAGQRKLLLAACQSVVRYRILLHRGVSDRSILLLGNLGFHLRPVRGVRMPGNAWYLRQLDAELLHHPRPGSLQ